MLESYREDAKAGNVMSFSTDLANGTYFVTFAAKASFSHWNGNTSPATGNATPIANGVVDKSAHGQTGFTTVTINDKVVDLPINIGTGADMIETYVVPVTVADGKFNISIDNVKDGANWHVFRLLSVVTGDPNDAVLDQNFESYGFCGSIIPGYQNKKFVTREGGRINGSRSYEHWVSAAEAPKAPGLFGYVMKVDNRKYKVEFKAKASVPNDMIYGYINGEKFPFTAGSTPQTFSAEVAVNDGNLEFGIKCEAGNTAEWLVLDDVKVNLVEQITIATAQKALDSEEYVNVVGSERAALEAAVASGNLNEVGPAYIAFTDAKASYNAWANGKALLNADFAGASAEILAKIAACVATPNTAAEAAEKGAQATIVFAEATVSRARAEGVEGRVDCTASIVNPNALDGQNGWYNKSIPGTAYNSNFKYDTPNGECPDSKWGVTKYWDKNGSNLGGILNQTVAVEPGVYRVSAIMRGNNIKFDSFCLKAVAGKVIVNSLDEPVKVDVNNIGNQGGLLGRGWNIYYVDVVVPTTEVTIGAEVANTAWTWFGFSNFTLVKIADVTPEQKAAYVAKIATIANEVLNDPAYANITGVERTELETLAASNSTEAAVLEAAIVTFKAAKANYDAYAAVANPTVSISDATTETKAAYNEAVASAVPTTSVQAAELANVIRPLLRAARVSHTKGEGLGAYTDLTSLIVNGTNPGNLDGWSNVAMEGYGNPAMKVNQGEAGAVPGMTKYFDGWSNSPWSTYFSQEVELEAGLYRLVAFMRSADSFDHYNLVFGDQKVAAAQAGNQGQEFDGGWNIYSVDYDVKVPGKVNIGVEAATKAGGKWVSFGNFALARVGAGTTALTEVVANGAAEYFDLQGRPVAAENLKAGLYIVRQGSKVSKVIVK